MLLSQQLTDCAILTSKMNYLSHLPQPVSEVHASLVLEAWQWHEFYAMLWFVVQLEMLADDETLHAYSGLPPWQKGV